MPHLFCKSVCQSQEVDFNIKQKTGGDLSSRVIVSGLTITIKICV